MTMIHTWYYYLEIFGNFVHSCDICKKIVYVTIFFVLLSFVSFCFIHFQTPTSFYDKLCSTICQVPLNFVSPQNWLCTFLLFYFKGFFFICEVLGFCKVLCVDEHCYLYDSYYLASVAIFGRSWCIFLLSFLCFNFLIFGLLIYLFLQHSWIQHLYVLKAWTSCFVEGMEGGKRVWA